MLKNKAGLWMSVDDWNFEPKNDLIYIKNISNTKFLGTSSNGLIIPQDFEEGKAQQLWKKGKSYAKGYFTLENSKVPKIMTAVSSTILKIKGKITLRWIVTSEIGDYLLCFFFTFRFQER